MDELPKGCRARYDEIQRRSSKLLDNFYNGNKGDVVGALEEVGTKPALAILALMLKQSTPAVRESITSYLLEVA